MTRPSFGKFEGNDSQEVSEYLFAWVQNGFVDDQCGESTTGAWHGLIVLGEMAVQELSTVDGFEPTTAAFVVHEDSQGFFTYESFESVQAAEIVFEAWRDAEEEGEDES